LRKFHIGWHVNWKESHRICTKYIYVFHTMERLKTWKKKNTRLQHKIELLLNRLKIKIDLRWGRGSYFYFYLFGNLIQKIFHRSFHMNPCPIKTKSWNIPNISLITWTSWKYETKEELKAQSCTLDWCWKDLNIKRGCYLYLYSFKDIITF
jgi:hypothetical protein